MIKLLLTAITASLLFTACAEKGPEKWTAYIYPDKSNSKRSMALKEVFPNLKACQEASIKKLEELDLTTRGFYECGLHCEYHDGMKTQICEKMAK